MSFKVVRFIFRFVQVNFNDIIILLFDYSGQFEKEHIKPKELDFTIADFKQHAKGYHKKFSLSNIFLGFLIDKSKYMGKTEGKWDSFNDYYVNGTSYGGLIGTPDAFMTSNCLPMPCIVSKLKNALSVGTFAAFAI